MTHARLEKKPYTPLKKSALLDSTIDLQQTFNALSKLYFPPDYKTLRELVLKIEEKYIQNVAKKPAGWLLAKPVPDQTRLDQIACITLLVEHLPVPDMSGKEATLKLAHMILLGALLYRYLRIESSYTSGYGIYGTADNSALKVVLFELLNLGENNMLDQKTIATCCGEYRNYLKQKGIAERYSYIKKDGVFFDNLDAIINTATIKAKPVNDAIKYILFIQSIPALLNRNDEIFNQNICRPLDEWVVDELKKNTVLNYKDFRLRLNNMTAAALSLRDYFDNHFLADDLEITAETKGMFNDDIINKMVMWYQYAILGAYVMCIHKCEPSSESELPSPLYKTLRAAIGVNAENIMDNKDKNYALTALEKYIELSTEPLLNLDVWGGMDLFKAELTRQLDTAKNPTEEMVENSLSM